MMERLFVYGSLQPGGPNEDVLGAVDGDWESAKIRGRLVDSGWGARIGYPGLLLDENAGSVVGHVLTSPTLSEHWQSLDAFEGKEYRRVQAPVTLAASGKEVRAYVYALRAEGDMLSRAFHRAPADEE